MQKVSKKGSNKVSKKVSKLVLGLLVVMGALACGEEGDDTLVPVDASDEQGLLVEDVVCASGFAPVGGALSDSYFSEPLCHGIEYTTQNRDHVPGTWDGHGCFKIHAAPTPTVMSKFNSLELPGGHCSLAIAPPTTLHRVMR